MSDSVKPPSCRAYARHRKCTPMAVSLAIRDGRLSACVVRDTTGRAIGISDFVLADREWEQNTDSQRRENAAGGVVAPSSAVPSDVDDAEGVNSASARLKNAQADLAELKFSEAAGELVPAADVAREWADLLSIVRTKLMGLPTALKQEIPSLSVAEVAKIEDTIRALLEDLCASEIAP